MRRFICHLIGHDRRRALICRRCGFGSEFYERCSQCGRLRPNWCLHTSWCDSGTRLVCATCLERIWR